MSGVGTALISVQLAGCQRTVSVSDVFFVPDFGFQILSVSALVKKGFEVSFYSGSCLIKRKGLVMARGLQHNNLYELVTAGPGVGLVASLQLWHKRLGHVDTNTILKISSAGSARGLKIASNSYEDFCPGCELGKGYRSRIPRTSTSVTKSLLGLVHTDTRGPLEVTSK